MPEEEKDIDDTTAGDAGDDTVTADADDTVAANAAADTLAAAEGDDTLPADDGKSPFEEFGEPGTKKEKPAAAAEPETAPDELDTKLEAVEAAIEADPTDPEAIREYAKLNRQVRERDAKERKRLAAQVAHSAEEAAYDQFERACGLPDAPAEVRRKLNRDAIKERFQAHYKAEMKISGGDASEARGAARANLKHEIQKIIAAAGPRKQAPKTKRTETGATLSPPGGGGGRTGKPAPNPENVFIDGNWSYPNAVGEA